MATDADPPPGLKTPDITKTDAVTFIAVLAAVAATFGFDMTGAQQAAAATVLVAVWSVSQQVADAIRRHGRAKVVAAAITAGSDPGNVVENLPAPTPPAVNVPVGAAPPDVLAAAPVIDEDGIPDEPMPDAPDPVDDPEDPGVG